MFCMTGATKYLVAMMSAPVIKEIGVKELECHEVAA